MVVVINIESDQIFIVSYINCYLLIINIVYMGFAYYLSAALIIRVNCQT